MVLLVLVMFMVLLTVEVLKVPVVMEGVAAVELMLLARELIKPSESVKTAPDVDASFAATEVKTKPAGNSLALSERLR